MVRLSSRGGGRKAVFKGRRPRGRPSGRVPARELFTGNARLWLARLPVASCAEGRLARQRPPRGAPIPGGGSGVCPIGEHPPKAALPLWQRSPRVGLTNGGRTTFGTDCASSDGNVGKVPLSTHFPSHFLMSAARGRGARATLFPPQGACN